MVRSCGTNNECTSGMIQCPANQCVQTSRNQCGNRGELVGSCSGGACVYRCPGSGIECGTDCCTGGQQCISGRCQTPCNNNCNSAGATVCSGSGTAVCNRDNNGCLRLGSVTACRSGETCSGGNCQCPSTQVCRPGNDHRCRNRQWENCTTSGGCPAYQPGNDCGSLGCTTYNGDPYCCADCVIDDMVNGRFCVQAGTCRAYVNL